MKTQVIIDTLKHDVPEFSFVGGAIDATLAVQNSSNKLPAAYVISTQKTTGDNQLIGGYFQPLTHHFLILICVRSAKDPLGFNAHDAADLLSEKVIKALSGLKVEGFDNPIKYESGSLYDTTRDGEYWWVDFFSIVDNNFIVRV